MKRLFMIVFVSMISLAGCYRPTDSPSTDTPRKEGGGVHIQAPGVDVKVKKGEGMDVEAPGTRVKVPPKE